MIEIFKDRLHELLKQKDVSLAMLYDREGSILWHKGRNIEGCNVEKGNGFCRSYIRDSIQNSKEIFKSNVYLDCDLPESESAKQLLIKSIIIYPIDKDFFLYIDSGIRMEFSEMEHGMIRMLASIFKDSIRQIRKNELDSGGISGESRVIRQVKDLVLKYSLEDDCVLLTGETGVGKTHIAELIHSYSGRKGKFVVVETSTINDNLFESEIFGHKKGAFTGAVENKRGLIDEAGDGTLFFDEISEIPFALQAKLLRLIEAKKYRTVGDPEEKATNVRILAASNKQLQDLIEEQKFRQDLFYRLNVLNIEIPPLRERKEDIRCLIHSRKKYLKGKETGEGFWKAVLEYPWPGNIRELFSVMKRAGIICDSPISGGQIKALIRKDGGQASCSQEEIRSISVWEKLQAGRDFWEVLGEPFLNHELTREQVKNIVDNAFVLARGKYINTLKIFNLPPAHYRRFMKFLRKHRLQ